MDFQTINLTKQDGIGVLTLNSPKVMNALNNELVRELNQALEWIAQYDEIRVLIITGGDKVFAAGGDIRAMLPCGPIEAKNYVLPIHNAFNQIADLPKPTIAAICGFALGGGVEMALTCDFRIAAANAKFGFPEINLGIFPAAGGSQRLPRLIGMTKAKELMFTGDTIDATTALSIGLVNEVVPTEDVMERATELAKKLAAKPPLALRSLKESMHNSYNMDLGVGLIVEIEKLANLFATLDQREGMTAFLKKRKPDFKGK